MSMLNQARLSEVRGMLRDWRKMESGGKIGQPLIS